LPLNTNANVTVFYHGHPQTDATWGGFSFNGVYAYNMGVGFSTQPHPFGRSWFPCFDNFIEHSLFEFSITTPKHYKAACNGFLQNHFINIDSTEVWNWKLNQEIVSYLAGVAVAPYATVHQTLTGINSNLIPVELTALPADTQAVKLFMNKLQPALTTFETSFHPYVWDKIGYVIVPFGSGAMEHASNIAYGRPFVNAAYESIYPHELSHHWFGDLVTCDNAGDMWLNEGWAVYCEKLFYENVYSKTRYFQEVKANHLEVLSNSHIRDSAYLAVANVPDNRTYGSTVYDKGADMIHTLRTYMGDAKFFSSLQQYFLKHQYKNSHTTQFRDSLIQYSGLNLTDYFNDWILQPGFPHFSIASWQADGINNSHITLTILQRQSHAKHAYHNVPVSITFFNQQFQHETHSLIIGHDGCNEFDFNLSMPKPICAIFDYDEMLSDAITSDGFILKNTGNKIFINGKATVNTIAVTDSAFVNIEHNWIRPEGFKTPHQGIHLADRFWTVKGVWKSDFDANVLFNYDGSSVSKLAYDMSFFGNQTEDSLVLFYRKDATYDWQIDNDATVNIQGSLTNKKGNFITKIKQGEYAFGVYDFNWHDTSAIGFSNTNCYLTSIKSLQKLTQNSLTIYPNPSTDKIFISLNSEIEQPKNIEIYSSNGVLIETYNWKENDNFFELNTWNKSYTNGEYYIKVKTTHEVYFESFSLMKN
jgi:aminopeptidase N